MTSSALRTLLVDNRDSFTFNLFQLLAGCNGMEPEVVENDRIPWAALEAGDFDNIVISPGPGRPEREGDFGACLALIRQTRLPLLGVCLGHQGIAHALGGRVRHAAPVHGRTSQIQHDGTGLFEGIPRQIEVVRYHSLAVDPALPACLRPTAWTADGLLMGVAHRSRPLWGVQFHPESICTEHGDTLLANLARLTPTRRGRRLPSAPEPPRPAASSLQLDHRRLPFTGESEAVFFGLFGQEALAFWLDSSRSEPGGARFSFLGAPGPHGASITVEEGRIRWADATGSREIEGSIFSLLERELARRRLQPDLLPFDFRGGFVGYLGYELRSREPGETPRCGSAPESAFLLIDRWIAIDHQEGEAWVCCLTPPGDTAALAWIEATCARLAELPEALPLLPSRAPLRLRADRDRERWLAEIAECQRLITEGESYELCLTRELEGEPVEDPLALYRHLRRLNPAPYAAFLRLGELAILSSSPERFLHIDPQGRVESKPIKGTRPRGADPQADARIRSELAHSQKDRAENLMIVDLLRNDLGRVCTPGSVSVPTLMAVETYQTVHQLVSTVRGQLAPGQSAIDCVRAAFPGGSMTGAPKRRSMAHLDQLEDRPRGIYSGALGYLSLSGAVDLSIVIRTMVATPEALTMGVGGAVVALSDPEEEVAEALLKASALVDALVAWSTGEVDPELREALLRDCC